ncbi:hypothetical protein ACES2I_08830 [Bdellovibrio bacteriovorus]|uniref:hypothetical protein n=1 Tax=Bdellovibrio bacteriovorus TaxID=959 RepID=UPI0035A58536
MKFIWCLALGSLILLVEPVMAKDLVDAAQSAQAMFNRIGIASISLGITGGGILFALGLGQIGRMVLMSGLIGAACILGGPGIISLLGKIFGMSL